MKCCWSLFNEIEMNTDGTLYFCCGQRTAKTPLGNIYTDKFEDIWNSELAVKMREEALKGRYPYCNHEICHKLSGNRDILFNEIMPHYKPVMERYPKSAALYMGRDCNAECIFCRDKIITSTQEEKQRFKENLKNVFLPMLRDAEIITVNDAGDAFGAALSRQFIKSVIKHRPDIKFKLMTNGICASKQIMKELDLENRIMELAISINAVTEETHRKIFRVGGWKLLLKNLDYLAELNKAGKIPHFYFKFVVCSHNWREMADFVKFAEKYGAKADFWEVRNYWQGLENKYEDIAVHLKEHKDYEEFKQSLQNPIFDSRHITLSPALIEIRNKV